MPTVSFYTYRCMYYICDDVKNSKLFQAKTFSQNGYLILRKSGIRGYYIDRHT